MPSQSQRERIELRPQPGPQTAFLSSSATIAIYGGAAGGGKTWSLLFEPLRNIHNPGFGGVIFRRSSPQITNEGGLWDESTGLYPLVGAKGSMGSMDWRFPSGANIGFRHLVHETTKFDWMGSQICFLGFDELPHFTVTQFWYLISRMRSTCGVKPYLRATCNPEPGWVKDLISQWVDKAHPDPARSGELRWFVRIGGELIWGHTEAELRARFPGQNPTSLTFIKSSVFDNKILLEKNPEYLARLQSLPRVERARLLDGDWDVRREGLILGELLDCIVDDVPDHVMAGRKIGGIDFGFNHPFVALQGFLDHDDVLWVTWERYQSGCTLPTHSAALPQDGTEWWADPSRPDSIVELQGANHHVAACRHFGTSPIMDGIDKITERMRTGRLKVHRSCQGLLKEAGLWIYDDKGKPTDADNHACDALRYMVVGLDRFHAIKLPVQPDAPETAQAEREKPRRPAEFLDPEDDRHWS